MTNLTYDPDGPRESMKRIRRIVKVAHKQGKRIDQIGFQGEDVGRSQIALQDLLTREQERHFKAREHIQDRNEIIEAMKSLLNEYSREVSYLQAMKNRQLVEFDEVTDNMNDKYNSLTQQVHELEEENNNNLRKLAAAMQTIKTMAEGCSSLV